MTKDERWLCVEVMISASASHFVFLLQLSVCVSSTSSSPHSYGRLTCRSVRRAYRSVVGTFDDKSF